MSDGIDRRSECEATGTESSARGKFRGFPSILDLLLILIVASSSHRCGVRFVLVFPGRITVILKVFVSNYFWSDMGQR